MSLTVGRETPFQNLSNQDIGMLTENVSLSNKVAKYLKINFKNALSSVVEPRSLRRWFSRFAIQLVRLLGH